jgi:hypothetical protein
VARSGRTSWKVVLGWTLAAALVIGLFAFALSPIGLHNPSAGRLAGPVAAVKACETETPTSPFVVGKSVLSQHIRYIATRTDPLRPVTKFGGQPNWISAPQWPLSRSTGKQMTFVGQVALDRTTFPGVKGRMAYLFVTADDDGGIDSEPWNPDAGENAVIVQPGGTVTVEVANDRIGPTSETSVKDAASGQYVDRPVVYRVALGPHVDAPFIDDTAIVKLSTPEQDRYFSALDGDKIGGTPAFIQPAEFPCTANRLLLQIENPPFYLNLGDGGDGFAYINDEGTAGKFLSQSH